MTAGAGKVLDTDLGYRSTLDRLAALMSVNVLVGVRNQERSDQFFRGPGLAQIAAYNEFGTSRIPERSFLRSTVDEHRAKYAMLLERAIKRIIDGKGDPRTEYGRIGLVAVGDVQRKIRSNVPPPNAPATIARKGSSKTLIDTGRLRQSIDYTIEGLGALGAA